MLKRQLEVGSSEAGEPRSVKLEGLVHLLFIMVFALSLTAVTPALARDIPIRVVPSGDTSGATDRFNILSAVEQAKALAPGQKKVWLDAGVFYLDGPLDLVNAPVSLEGRGVGATILTNAPGAVFGADLYGGFIRFSLDAPWDFAQVCQIAVMDLTIETSGLSGHRDGEFDVPLTGIEVLRASNSDPTVQARYHATFRGLEFKAQLGANFVTGSSMWYGIWVGENNRWVFDLAPIEIDVEISKSVFTDVASPIEIDVIENSNVLITDNKVQVAPGTPALQFFDASNSRTEVTKNVFDGGVNVAASNGTGAVFLGLPEPEPSTWWIAENYIRTVGDYPIDIRDWLMCRRGVPTMNVGIWNNDLVSVDAPRFWAGGIFSRFVDDMLIAFNRISGNAAVEGAFPIGVRGSKRNLIFQNDASGFVAHPDTPQDIWFYNGAAENVVFKSGTVLDDSDDPSTPEYDGLNYIVK